MHILTASLGQLTSTDFQKLITALQAWCNKNTPINIEDFGKQAWSWLSEKVEGKAPLDPLRTGKITIEELHQVFNEIFIKSFFAGRAVEAPYLGFEDFLSYFNSMCEMSLEVKVALQALNKQLVQSQDEQNVQIIVFSHTNKPHLAYQLSNLASIEGLSYKILDENCLGQNFPSERFIIVTSMFSGQTEHLGMLEKLVEHFPQLQHDVKGLSLVKSIDTENYPHCSKSANCPENIRNAHEIVEAYPHLWVALQNQPAISSSTGLKR